MFRITFIVLAMASAAVASAQSFNIDAGNPRGTASAAFGAAAGQAGAWNGIAGMAANTPVALAGLNGAPTSVTLTASAVANGFFFDNPATSGDTDALMDDYFDLVNPTTFTFSGLAAGP